MIMKSFSSTNDGMCRYCGKPLEVGTTSFKGLSAYTQCGCEPSQKHRMQYEEERERREKEEIESLEVEGRKRTIERHLNTLGRRFKSRTFDNYDKLGNEATFDICLEYAKNFKKNGGQGLLFTGSVGTGKTHLSASICNYIITQFVIPVKFGNITDLLGEIKTAYDNTATKTEQDFINELSEVNLLVLDDLGKEKGTEWSNSMIYRIINKRYENYKATIVTTNLSLRQLEQNLGEATTSRIFEMCKGVKLDGVDRRKTRLIGGNA